MKIEEIKTLATKLIESIDQLEAEQKMAAKVVPINPSDSRLLYRPVEVAKMLGLSRSQIYHLVNTGQLPALQLESAIMIPRDSVTNWINSKLQQRKLAIGG